MRGRGGVTDRKGWVNVKERKRKIERERKTFKDKKRQEERGGVKEKEKGQERKRVSRVWAARIRFPHSSYRHT